MKRVKFYRSPKPSMLRTILLALGALVAFDLMTYSFNRPNNARKYRMPDKTCLVTLHMKSGKSISGFYEVGSNRFWATKDKEYKAAEVHPIGKVEVRAYPVKVSNMSGWSLR